MVQRNLFRHGIGRHDRVGGVGSAGESAAHLLDDLGHTREHFVHREAITDQTRGTDSDLDGAGLGSPVAQRFGNSLCRRVRVLEAQRSGTGVGATRIEDDGAQPAGGEHLLAPQHRRSLDLVAGEDACRRVVGALVEDQREVGGAGSLDTGGDSRRTEPERCCHALIAQQARAGRRCTAGDPVVGVVDLRCCVACCRIALCRIATRAHGATPTVLSPSASSQSSARFID
ncbi:Uncharacterised protein [Mycobacteroides abscessus subsp. abscessus]|nr:Uncharacterised protein [Mycobacteroides abscessus subsp. abscessus]